MWVLRIPIPIRIPYVLEAFALFASIPLTYLTHERTRSSSAILLLFWPAYAIAILMWARTLLSTTSTSEVLPVLVGKCVIVVLGLASFALELLGPEHTDPFGHENPITTANIFSRWSFGWMTPLMKKGATEYITEDDLPSLLERDESAKLSNDLKNALGKVYVSLLSHYDIHTDISLKWTGWKSPFMEGFVCRLRVDVPSCCLFENSARLLRLSPASASALVTCIHIGLPECLVWHWVQ